MHHDSPGSTGEVARAFGLLGLTAFGGPTAHLGYFREEFVARRKWLSDAHYSHLVALCQFLPGPASSQVGMALGFHRAGYVGMFIAWLMFTAPSAIALGAFAMALSHFAIDPNTGWLQGLLAAAVGVVAHAVWSMGKSMVTSLLTLFIAVLSGAVVLTTSSAFTQVAVIVAGGAATALLMKKQHSAEEEKQGNFTESALRAPSKPVAITATAAFGVLLLLALAVGSWSAPWLFERTANYIYAGSLVFGGGHVVLPMLESQVVPQAVDPSTFLAGYSAAQAVPGPLFTFASFLGAAEAGFGGAVLATVAIFLPAALLTIAGLHFYADWMRNPTFRRALIGINAAVVGILAATLWDPVITHGIIDNKPELAQRIVAVAIAVAAWLGLSKLKLAPWMIAAGAAIIGAVAL